MVLNPEQATEPTLGMIESQLVEEPVTVTSDSARGVNAQSSELVITRPEIAMSTVSPDNVRTSQYPQRNHCPPEFYTRYWFVNWVCVWCIHPDGYCCFHCFHCYGCT